MLGEGSAPLNGGCIRVPPPGTRVTPRPRSATRRRQDGAVLLLTLVLVLAAVGYGLLRSFNQTSISIARQDRTAAALAEAKQALIAHALLYGESHKTNASGGTNQHEVTLPPGTLPCPEQSFFANEGSESGNCGGGGAAALGRLPWRSLGLAPLRDGSGECLWYAVSGAFKANPGPDVLNQDSLGQFRVVDASNNSLTGATAATRAVAVIIAPGAPLPGQNRAATAGTDECGGNYTPGNYLDRLTIAGSTYDNAAIDTTPGAVSAILTASGESFNDLVVYITREELFAPIEKRSDFATGLFDPADVDGKGQHPALAQKVAAMIALYGRNNATTNDKRLPWAAPLNVANFAADTFDDISGLYAGRPPYRVGTSRTSTNNTLVPSGCSPPPSYCRLLIVDNAGLIIDWWRAAGKPLDTSGASVHSSRDGWWDKWKDHFFYVVSPEFAPNSSVNWTLSPNPCNDGGNKCVRVNGKRFAAAIIFAGKRRSVQQRDSLADRQVPANYLEGTNVDAVADQTSVTRRDLEFTGNDQIVCIRAEDLTIDSTCINGT